MSNANVPCHLRNLLRLADLITHPRHHAAGDDPGSDDLLSCLKFPPRPPIAPSPVDDEASRMLEVFNLVQRRLGEDNVVTAPPVVGVVDVGLDKVDRMAIGSPTRGLDALGRQPQTGDAAEDATVQQAALETTVAAAQT